MVKRVAIITGAGTGIGAAAAKQFALTGTAVALVGRRLDKLVDTLQAIQAAGSEGVTMALDVGQPSAPSSIVDQVIQKWGRIDVLVNNAATIKTPPFEQVTFEEFENHFAVNVRGPYFLTQAALPFLKKSGSGVVINISSSSGSLTIPGQSIYGMSKAALEYQTRSLAAELAPSVRVNCIAPGPVDTPIHLTWAGDDIQAAYARMTKEVPLARMGTAEELGKWIVWLASAEASFVTGVVIPVDGGQVLPGALSVIAQE